MDPLVRSAAVERLRGISFLGILSPRYANIPGNPIYKRPTVKTSSFEKDGSREDHSINVAKLALHICRALRLTEEQQRYAAAWGLLHDIGNWPLSHTAQQAFSEILDVNTKTVREWIVTNDQRAPRKYFVADELNECGIDPNRLLLLFRKIPDKGLQPVSDIFRSKITPDMLDGIWRSAKSFGVEAFDLDRFRGALCHDLADNYIIHPDYHKEAERFWRIKRNIYNRFFSSKSAVQFESRWSLAVKNYFGGSSVTFEQSLEMNEEKLVKEIASRVPSKSNDIYRWKAPVKQRIKRPIPKDLTIESLDNVFIEESVSLDEYK